MIPDPSTLKAGEILLYRDASFVDFIITRTGPAGHVEIYEGNGKSLASRNGLGVSRYDLRMDGLIAVLECPTLDMAKFTAWFETVNGEGYSWGGLLGFGEGETTGQPNQMFCSQFIAEGCKRAGSPVINKDYPSGLVTPSDFLKSPAVIWKWADTSKMWL